MVNERSYILGSQRSCIRELFEYGRRRAAEVGAENIYDFSLGNPSVPTPDEIKAAYLELLDTKSSLDLHGYTSAAGCNELREAVADSLTRRFGLPFHMQDIYVTCGAAAGLTSTIRALAVDENSEFIALAPYFPEYKPFTECAGGKFAVVPADEENFQINFEALEKTINKNTRGVIVNSPNNPSGVVYTAETVKTLASLLEKKSTEYGAPIYIISDEPYRELAYGVEVPFIPNFYDNTVVCYSYSKCLSMPGDRIGYVAVNDKVTDRALVFDAIAGAARGFGYVCAPSLTQKVVAKCVDVMPDLTVYRKNRDILYNSLTEMGYHCAKPDGAFYLLVKSPKGSGDDFSEFAKKYDVLVVPCAGFGCPDFVRISYCVDTDMIERSLPKFREIFDALK